jgi:DNA-binding CsgD family transcriptional regulator
MIRSDYAGAIAWKVFQMTSSQFSACLLDIYDAAANPGRWRHALDHVSDYVDAQATMVLVRKPSGWQRNLQLLSSKYLEFAKSPAGVYYSFRFARLQNPDWDYLRNCPPLEAIHDTQAGLSAGELDARGDYAYLRRKLQVGRRLGVRLNADRMWFDAISIGCKAGAGPATANQVARLQSLQPHLMKAVETSRLFLEMKKQRNTARGALDFIDLPLWVLGPSGEVLLENDRAREVLSLADGLTRNSKGFLECHGADDTRALANATAHLCETAAGQGTQEQRQFSVTRPSGRESYLVDMAPLSDSRGALIDRKAAVLVTVVDPDRPPLIKIDRFAKVYGLTPAETEVCGHAISGLKLEHIAEQRGTTPITTKNQMAQILSKTQTHNRSELLRLVLKTHLPIRELQRAGAQ